MADVSADQNRSKEMQKYCLNERNKALKYNHVSVGKEKYACHSFVVVLFGGDNDATKIIMHSPLCD